MKKLSALKAAFPVTIPVLLGYLSIGMAFGLMLQAVGYGPLWAVFMSITIYAGSGQYLGCSLLAQGSPLLQVALLTGLINFRHIFYGLSLLSQFKDAGKKKPYMIFALTDETYALLTSAKPPEGVNPSNFYFSISLLDHLYWILGSLLGNIIGTLVPFDTTGIDFAMTALFVVIAVEQWLSISKRITIRHAPAIIGLVCAVGSLLIFGKDQMLIPSLIVTCLVLMALKNKLEASEVSS